MKTIAFINSTVNKTFMENCNIMDISCGEANGYVAVPPGHPLFGKNHEDIDGIDVHGGLTFSGQFGFTTVPWADVEFISDTKEVPSDWWGFGFDTMHFGDSKYTWPKERVKEETQKLQEQLENVEKWKEK